MQKVCKKMIYNSNNKIVSGRTDMECQRKKRMNSNNFMSKIFHLCANPKTRLQFHKTDQGQSEITIIKQ